MTERRRFFRARLFGIVGATLLGALAMTASAASPASSKAASLEEFMAQLTPDMTPEHWQERFGKPVRDLGSGLYILQYDVQDGGLLSVTFSTALLSATLDGCTIWRRPRYNEAAIRAQLAGYLTRKKACKVPWIAAAIGLESLTDATKERMVRAVNGPETVDRDEGFWAAVVLAMHGFNHGVPVLRRDAARETKSEIDLLLRRAALILAGELGRLPRPGADESSAAPELSRLTLEPLPDGPTTKELRDFLARHLAQLTEAERDHFPAALRDRLLVPPLEGPDVPQLDGHVDLGGWWWDPRHKPRPTLMHTLALSEDQRVSAVIEVCDTGGQWLLLPPKFVQSWRER